MNRPPRPASGRSTIHRFVSRYLPLPLLAAPWFGVAVAAAVVVIFVVAAMLVGDDAGIVVVVTNKEVAIAVSLIKVEAEICVALAPAAAELFSLDNMTCLKSTPKFSKQYF